MTCTGWICVAPLLGWTPQVGLDEGLYRTVESFRTARPTSVTRRRRRRGVPADRAHEEDDVTDALERLVERFGSHTALVGVIGIGLGYVWLPQALGFAEAGFRVCGFDTDPVKS